MVLIFYYKIKLWGKIKTVVLLLLLFFIPETVVISSGEKEQKSLNSSLSKKKKSKKTLTGYQVHFRRQTKKVQKRMKEDNKKTKRYYNQKLGYTLLQRLFGKNKKY